MKTTPNRKLKSAILCRGPTVLILLKKYKEVKQFECC